jgi:hypothetical protein
MSEYILSNQGAMYVFFKYNYIFILETCAFINLPILTLNLEYIFIKNYVIYVNPNNPVFILLSR